MMSSNFLFTMKSYATVVIQSQGKQAMTPARRQALHRWLDRAFTLIWLGFPVVLALSARDALTMRARAAADPSFAPCAGLVPDVAALGQLAAALWWGAFAIEFAFYAAVLFLAHRVVRRCAQGRALVAEMIGTLRAIGLLIASWPVVDLVLSNGLMAALHALGELPFWEAHLLPDLPTLGVGLLFLTMAEAMAQAVALREDADLTI
jgi:hypothetical protein